MKRVIASSYYEIENYLENALAEGGGDCDYKLSNGTVLNIGYIIGDYPKDSYILVTGPGDFYKRCKSLYDVIDLIQSMDKEEL